MVTSFRLAALATLCLAANVVSGQVDENLRERTLALVRSGLNSGPERYTLRSRIHGRDPRNVMKEQSIEVLRDGPKLRIVSTIAIENFTQLEVRESNAFLINRSGSYKLGKGAGTDFFVLWESCEPTAIEDKATLVQRLGYSIHADCVQAIGDWLSEWVVLPGLSGKEGYHVERLIVEGDSIRGRIECPERILRPFNYMEDKTFEFLIDPMGHITSFSCGYDRNHPSVKYVETLSWKDGRFNGSLGKLKDGDETLSTWETLVGEYSDAPIDSAEFSLAYFGLSAGGFRLPIGWAIAFGIIGVGGILVWWARR